MPIRKVRSVREMSEPAWYMPGDPAQSKAIDAVWSLTRATSSHRFAAGVQRFRSAEKMHRAQDKLESARVRRALDRPAPGRNAAVGGRIGEAKSAGRT